MTTHVHAPIQHVLKDKRVLALIQKRAAEEEGREVSEEWDEDIVTYVSIVASNVPRPLTSLDSHL